MLNLRGSLSLALSSTAPMYSVLVTAPLIVALVGLGAPLAYALAAIPAVLVSFSMATNDRLAPDKGTVYRWAKGSTAMSWLSGFCLAVTGIIATSGLAFVAADLPVALLLPDGAGRIVVTLVVAVALIAGAMALGVRSVQATSVVQNVGLVVQLVAMVYAVVVALTSDVTFAPITGGAMDWFHAVLLAVFAYWGFDAVFALTEETKRHVPRVASMSSILVLVAFFAVMSGVISSPELDALLKHPLIVVAVVISAVMSLGSTLIPTVRGVEAMAEDRDLPRALASRPAAGAFAVVLASAWTLVTALWPGFFSDSIDALSVFVGVYFVVAAASAFVLSGRRWIHLVSAGLMAFVTLATAVQTFELDYGQTVIFGVGGVGVIVAGIALLGVAGSVWSVIWHRRLIAAHFSW